MSPKGVEHGVLHVLNYESYCVIVHSSMSPKGVEHNVIDDRTYVVLDRARSAFINVAERR